MKQLIQSLRKLNNKRAISTILFLIVYIIALIYLPGDNGWDHMPTDSRVNSN